VNANGKSGLHDDNDDDGGYAYMVPAADEETALSVEGRDTFPNESWSATFPSEGLARITPVSSGTTAASLAAAAVMVVAAGCMWDTAGADRGFSFWWCNA